MPDGWQICTNGRKVPTAVGDFGLVVFGVWLFGFRVCDISGISRIAHCDLDGDGVETVTAEGGVYFDHDANGFKENSGWVGQDDGILVRDINGNGIIDNGTELFGNNSVLSSGEKAVNGFEALKDLDDNNDGIFDRNDKAWNEVKIWQDKNFNGNYSIVKSANPVFA